MPIDASIPLQAQNQVQPPNLLNQATQGLQLKSLFDEDQQRKQSMQQQQALMDAYRTSDTSTDEGKQNLIKKVSQINPEMGMKIQKQYDESAKTKAETANQQSMAQEHAQRVADQKMENIDTELSLLLPDYEKTAKTAGPQQAWAQVQPKIQQTLQRMQLETGPDGKPLYSREELNQLASVQSPEQLYAAASHSSKYLAASKERRETANTASEIQDRDVRQKQKQQEIGIESGRLGVERENVNLRRQELTGGGAPPAGYRRAADGNLEFIPGGPADPKTKAGSMGGRQEVVFNRIMSGATESARDLGNIVNLPMSADRGVFGGRQQGGGLLAATKEDMANKMTSQEAQSYNVRVSGLQRNLAAIEASGLAPAGSLTHSMDALVFKEGDTNKTKLEKLAQSRQIIEAGAEVALNTPGITKDQKEQAQRTLDSIKESIPFTIQDLDKLSDLQDRNPKATLKQVIGENKKKTDASSADHPEDISALLEKYGK